MKKVVVAVDGSPHAERALDLAIEMAAKFQAPLVAVHVVVPPYVPPEPYATGSAGLELAIREYGEHVAQKAAGKASAAKIPATWRVETGSPAEMLVETAQAEGADLIVVGSRGHGALRRMLLGSVSDRVVRISTIPVLVVH